MNKYKIGIDIGSTTVKTVLMKNSKIVFSDYARHFSDIKTALIKQLGVVKDKFANPEASVSITGSGGLSLSKEIDATFIQEVIAVSQAIEFAIPKTDVAIEIGGEDAKIIYFGNSIEHRMNGICAGGTGSFIDQMAALLQVETRELNDLAKNHSVIYPIAARCGVFAKTDIQPLINQGVNKEDLAASIFQAVASQTVGGLACGKPIRGNVAFLGGPLHFLPELRNTFIKLLNLKDDEIIVPENSNLFAAIGASLAVNEKYITIDELIHRLSGERKSSFEVKRLDPLFKNVGEYEDFLNRHNENFIEETPLSDYTGNIFLGIDAGSTTTKIVLLGEDNQLLHTFYSNNKGKPVATVIPELIKIYKALPKGARIVNSCATGYGEDLLKASLKVDLGEIETVAHYKAASFFRPDVDFIIDIGGQDMKCITISNGVIDNVLLNEACSAGCGSFLETFANSLNKEIKEFARLSLFSKNPIDLGSRCTVFMNSRVKQAQKEGATVEDISAGLSYSVIKNALQKVIKVSDMTKLGENIVVQGGTFHNDGVLRAFEVLTTKNVIRPNIAGIMGAFGAALIAKENYTTEETTLLNIQELENFTQDTTYGRCKKCSNNCLLSINTFGNGDKFITGNRCEKGLGNSKADNNIPNIYAYKLTRLFSYENNDNNTKGTIGIPRVLNIYENYPLWHKFFNSLGYNVVLSSKSSRKIYEKGIESIPSESVCYPAKLCHGHIMDLIEKEVDYIFYPSIVYELDNPKNKNYNCPVVISYSENIKNNVEDLDKTVFLNPFLNLSNIESMAKTLSKVFPKENTKDIYNALHLGIEELNNYRKDVKAKGLEYLQYLDKNNMEAFVLTGRPYHIDEEINHGIPELITSFGIGVLSEDSLPTYEFENKDLNVMNQWSYHGRLYSAANYVSKKENLELIQLNSFGCGIDAITAEEVKDILNRHNKIHTLLKIDEVNNLGPAKIRVRSLIAALKQRREKGETIHFVDNAMKKVEFTKEMRKTHTLLCPQMAPLQFNLIQEAVNSEGYNMVLLPEVEKESIDTGLKYVNNDACYPALIVVGQILNAINSGKYDTNNLSVFISQTGGSCRASNYIGLIRRALREAGYDYIPVVSISASGIEKNSGFKLTLPLLNKCLQAIIIGDLFMRVLYKTRPYEKVEGSANKLYEYWNKRSKEAIKTGSNIDYKYCINGIVEDFDKLELVKVNKPKVGIVGEILVKFHPTANNDIVSLLESEGAEVVSPDLLSFFLYSFYNPIYNSANLGTSKKAATIMRLVNLYIEKYRSPLIKALKNSNRFTAPESIKKLAEYAAPIVSIGNQSGEGWFLTAEIIELIHEDVFNVVCMQPFACLPNHITGKGVIKKIKDLYPESNIVAIDYDPGASEVNQLNRIKLMLSTAEKNIGLSHAQEQSTLSPKEAKKAKNILQS